MTGSSSLISFKPYYEGAVPVQVVNTTNFAIQYGQNAKYVIVSRAFYRLSNPHIV